MPKGIIRTVQRMSEKLISRSAFLKKKGVKPGIALAGMAGLGFFLNHLGGRRHVNQDQENY